MSSCDVSVTVTSRHAVYNATIIRSGNSTRLRQNPATSPQLQNPQRIEEEITRWFEGLEADVQSITVIEEQQRQ
jgi:hypothetical protein